MLDALRDATGLAAGDIGRLVNTHKDGDHWFGNRLMRHAEIIASQATVEAMRHARPSLFHDAFVNRPEGILGDYIVKIFGLPFDFEDIDPVLPERPPVLSDMQTGRLLIRAGRLEHARAFLLKVKPTGEEEWIERLFLLGRIEMRLGMPKEAAGRFEDILEIRPGLTRVRLELARAYYLMGQHDKARRQFSASLGDKLPSSVEAAVENFLRRIDARKRWSVSVSGVILPESNPAKRTDREEVRIGGVPFRLNEDARASSGVGGLIAAGVSFSPAIGTGLRGVLGASGGGQALQAVRLERLHGLRRCRPDPAVRPRQHFRWAAPRPAVDRRRSPMIEVWAPGSGLVSGSGRARPVSRRLTPRPRLQHRVALNKAGQLLQAMG